MSESFNPYVEWLGLPGGRQPTNHYELLGLPLFENNPQVIAQAADGQIARLRGVRPGQHAVQWQQMLDELSRAKACMTAPAVKSAYDAELCRQIQSGSARPTAAPGGPPTPPQSPQLAVPPGFQPPQPTAPSFPSPAAPVPPNMTGVPPWNQAPPATPAPIPMGTPVAKPVAAPQPVFPQPGNVEPIVVRRDVYQPRRSKSSAGLIVAQVGLIGLILVGAGFAYMLYQQRQREAMATATPQTVSTQNGSATEPKTPASPPESDTRTPPKPIEPKQPKSPPKDNPPVGTTPETKPDQPEVKPEPKPEVKPATVATTPAAKPEASLDPQKQRALKQTLTDVRASLAEADLQAAQNFLTTAAKYVQSDDDKAEVGRLESLTHNLGEFWKTMGQIVGKLQAMDEIPVRDYQVIVVEVGPNMLTIKASGQVREYSPLSEMPHLLVTSLADWQFGKDPQSKAVYASYLALAPKGDRQRARQLWQEAIDAGVDVRYLLPELDQAPAASAPLGSKRPAPSTDQNTLQQTEAAVRAQFRQEYEQATSPAGKAQLAQKLLRASEDVSSDPNASFVMVREARDLALAAGQPGLVCEAIDELARFQAIDVLTMKTTALEEIGKDVRGVNSCKGLVQSALPLIEEAMNSGQRAEARRLAEVATAAAQKSKSPTLLKQVRAVTEALEASGGGAKPKRG